MLNTSGPQGHQYERNVINGGTVYFGDVHHRSDTPLQHSKRDSDGLYTVPRHSCPSFTGRQKQERRVAQLFESDLRSLEVEQHKIVVIHGLGGSGKTQFCLRYAERLRSRYGDCGPVNVVTLTPALQGQKRAYTLD